jgi:hypothetical protein
MDLPLGALNCLGFREWQNTFSNNSVLDGVVGLVSELPYAPGGRTPTGFRLMEGASRRPVRVTQLGVRGNAYFYFIR